VWIRFLQKISLIECNHPITSSNRLFTRTNKKPCLARSQFSSPITYVFGWWSLTIVDSKLWWKERLNPDSINLILCHLTHVVITRTVELIFVCLSFLTKLSASCYCAVNCQFTALVAFSSRIFLPFVNQDTLSHPLSSIYHYYTVKINLIPF